ncbi:hypothetical protein EU95_0539 [Prochlorococcus marinus str. MIT 9201]|uniref:Polysaccharide chain length determinant N-terminal domain-containing protein n=1 Tax=Prochlorococcus marinus str. MIT 9201 TaxID=93057 RepID=A0A0A2A822_PROMR|nr:Wzz/FepE/Etk N-terminal domain-containing protein [Prochlorococcus marinus]KGF96654.1 hypothetical protein EU95_0539 [Prochlorococcus marinus str. MIT 9201]
MEDSNNTVNQNYDSDRDEIDIKSFFKIFKRGKNLIFGIVLSSTLVTGLYSFITKPKWSGSFNIVVKKNSQDSSGINPLENYGIFNEIINNDENETQRLILKSPSVLMPVFNFVKNYYEYKNINIDKLSFKEWVDDNLIIDFENNSSVLKVEYINEDKKLIKEALELISSKYKAYSKRDTEKQITKTIKYLKKQTKLMKEKSLNSMKAFNEFSINNGLGSIDGFVGLGPSVSLGGDPSGRELMNKLGNPGAEKYTENLRANKIFQADTISNSKAGMRYEAQFEMLMDYEAQFVDLSSKLKPNSNTLKELKSNIENLRDSLKRPNEILLEYRRLKLEASRNEGILQELESSLQVLELNKIKAPDPWEMISVPTIDSNPIFPKKERLIIGSLIISLIIGYLIAFIKEKSTGKIFELSEYKFLIKYKYLDTIYRNNIKVNTNIIDNLIDINDNVALVELSDNFLGNQIPKKQELFKEEREFCFVNLKDIETLSKFKKIILITEGGIIAKANIHLIEKYLIPYEKTILGWFYLD